jgi:site-specific DNA-methyltransferase (adenine-specific)
MAKHADLLKSRRVLAIVDPEFGIGISKSARLVLDKGLQSKGWDDKPINPKYFDVLFSVSLNQIIWGGNYYALPANKHCVIWDKMQPEGMSFGMFDYAWTSFNRANKMFRNSATQTGDEIKIHECQKPIALYKWLLEKYSAGHDLILDTHVGSASSLIACEDFGIDYVAFELDSDYYRMANERLLKARFEREAKVSETCVTTGLSLFGEQE